MRANEFVTKKQRVEEHVNINTSPFRDQFQRVPLPKERKPKKKKRINDLFDK